MQPLRLLLEIIGAAGSFAKSGPMRVPETTLSARSLSLPPPTTVNELPPFHFPTDYDMTGVYVKDLPEFSLYCSKNSEWISPSFVGELVNGSFLQSTMDTGTIPSKTGWVWHYPLNNQSSQIYVCNYNRLYGFSISAGLFGQITRWLDDVCGETLAGYVYLNMPWDLAIGRNSTDSQGNPNPECG